LGLGTRIDPDDVPLVLSLRPDRALADVVSDGEMGSGADAQKLVKIVRTFRELIALGMVLVPEMSSESR
jgi:chromosome condensin MukBEF MukE localization factor